MQEERPRVRKAGQVIRGRRGFRLLVLHRILNRKRHFRCQSQNYTQVVFAERIFSAVIQGQDADRPIDAFQWNCQSRSQRAEFARVVQISGFDRWVAVQDRFAVVSHPA